MKILLVIITGLLAFAPASLSAAGWGASSGWGSAYSWSATRASHPAKPRQAKHENAVAHSPRSRATVKASPKGPQAKGPRAKAERTVRDNPLSGIPASVAPRHHYYFGQ